MCIERGMYIHSPTTRATSCLVIVEDDGLTSSNLSLEGGREKSEEREREKIREGGVEGGRGRQSAGKSGSGRGRGRERGE